MNPSRKSALDPYPATGQHPPSYRDAMYVPSRTLGAPGTEPKRYHPLTLRNWVVAVVVITLIGLAIGIEVALAISTKNGGFATPVRNVFTGVSPRFLTAFIPTLLVAGLLLIWQSSDRSYRELQPYIVLARGNVTAAEGLLANYSGLSVYGTISNALKFRHWLILLSTITTLFGSLLQPLAGSILQLTQLPQTTNGITIHSTKTIALTPDVAQLNAFLAAAGYAEAAVFHGLGDPPFVRGGWSVAEFTPPSGSMLNGTLFVNTTSIQTTPHCEASQTSTLSTPGTSNFTIQATNSAGCNGSVTFNTSLTADSQYGAISIDNCGSDDVQFQPVMFWFFHRKNDDIQTPQAASVFCNPTIGAFNVMAEMDLSNSSIVGITPLDNVTTSNNVTGGTLNGRAFNSLKFTPSNDSFVQARAISINAGVSGAIFRFASQLPGGVQPTFDDPNGFLAITNKVYTQHLSISAKSIYFVNAPSSAPARIVSLFPRLWIDALPAHALVAVLLFIGLSALFLHIAHSRQRRHFFLTASPGSIAHIISMTAHARFGEQLYPYDNDETLARKLAGLSFSLDPRTGAVVADRDVGPITVPLGAVTPYPSRPRGERTITGMGTYADDAESQTTRLLGPIVNEKRGRAPSSSGHSHSRGSSRGGGSSSDLEQELEEARLLPAYSHDGASQSTLSVNEKQGARTRESSSSRASPSTSLLTLSVDEREARAPESSSSPAPSSIIAPGPSRIRTEWDGH
ncbi:hypothetical protein C8R44DRAFT_820004 [Mycena epipterygia]|nr:hypothetical protein C8R44DRAFT_820004 [Mycena epipterygia]